MSSGGSLEEPGDEGRLRLHVATTDFVNLPFPDHRHRLVASQCPSSGFQVAEPKPRPDQPFDAAVVLL